VPPPDITNEYNYRLRGSARYLKDIYYIADRRKPFVTDNGWIGLGSAAINISDYIYWFNGHKESFILRKQRDQGPWYFLIGESYVYRLTMELITLQGIQEESFLLI